MGRHPHYRPCMDNRTWGIICRDVDAYYCRGAAMRRGYRWYTPAELAEWIPRLIAARDLHAFYITKAWLHLRAEVLREQHYECQVCKGRGLYTPATTVHHKRTVKQAPWLALTKSNCVAVCDACHYEIHHGGRRPPKRWHDERW